MPLNLASPGVLVREVDLTNGRIDPTSDSVGVIASPFEKGAVNEPVLVNEEELRQAFGGPAATDKHYENWMNSILIPRLRWIPSSCKGRRIKLKERICWCWIQH